MIASSQRARHGPSAYLPQVWNTSKLHCPLQSVMSAEIFRILKIPQLYVGSSIGRWLHYWCTVLQPRKNLWLILQEVFRLFPLHNSYPDNFLLDSYHGAIEPWTLPTHENNTSDNFLHKIILELS